MLMKLYSPYQVVIKPNFTSVPNAKEYVLRLVGFKWFIVKQMLTDLCFADSQCLDK